MCSSLEILNIIVNIISLLIAFFIIMFSFINYLKKEEKSLITIIRRSLLIILIVLLIVLIKLVINTNFFAYNILSCKKNNLITNNTCIYFQNEYEQYKYGKVEGANIKDYGCGPTSSAVVLCTMLKDNSYDPVRVTKEICDMNGCSSSGTNMIILIKYLNSKGLKTTVHDMYYKIGNFNHEQAEQDIYTALKNNNMVILHTVNHFFVISGLESGKLKIVQVGDRFQSDFLYSYKELREMVEKMKVYKNYKLVNSYIQGYIIVSR